MDSLFFAALCIRSDIFMTGTSIAVLNRTLVLLAVCFGGHMVGKEFRMKEESSERFREKCR